MLKTFTTVALALGVVVVALFIGFTLPPVPPQIALLVTAISGFMIFAVNYPLSRVRSFWNRIAARSRDPVPKPH